MKDSKVVQTLAGLVAAASVAAIAITLRGGFGPAIESKAHEAAGWAMAREAMTLLKPGGELTVIARDTAAFKNPATDIQLASFKRELRRAKVKISSVQLLQVDPLRQMEVPSTDFLEWIRKSPPGSVVVSFMGPPVLTAAERKQLKEIKPSIVAFCPGNLPGHVNLRPLFEQHVLHAAIVSRRNQTSPAAKPQSLQAWFDQSFAVITAANVGDSVTVSASQ